MKVTRIDWLREKVLRDLHAEMEGDRPPGLHVTDLIYCLTKTYLLKSVQMSPNDEETMLFASGLGLESVLLKRFERVKPIQVDGIWLSLDFFAYEGAMGEFKSTRKGCQETLKTDQRPLKDRIMETGHWKKQVMSYLYAACQTKIALMVLHLMGNYAPPFPDLTCWEVEFDQAELDEHWAWILYRKEILEAHLGQGKGAPEPFKYNEPWECTNCRFKMICQAGAV